MKIYQKLGLILSLSVLLTHSALASISVGTTRIIIREPESSQSVDINNRSQNQPYLINVGISDNLSGKESNSAFIATPALFRIEPGASHKVRVLKKSNNMPGDRESVFYFNVMAIPTGKAGMNNANNSVGGALQVATGNTVKLFYRPGNLSMTQKEAMSKLQFSRDGQGVKVSNPTPYFISFKKLVIGGKRVGLDVVKGTAMVAPFASQVYPVAVGNGKAEWVAINDFGGGEKFSGSVN